MSNAVAQDLLRESAEEEAAPEEAALDGLASSLGDGGQAAAPPPPPAAPPAPPVAPAAPEAAAPAAAEAEAPAPEAEEAPAAAPSTAGVGSAASSPPPAAPPPDAPPAPPAPPSAAKAPKAPEEAEPDQESAARDIASAKGGDPLPAEVKEKLEPELGKDLSKVEVHTGESAVDDIDAGAAAIGQHVFLAPGAPAPTTPEGLGLMAHEAAHTTDPSAPSSGDLTLGGTDTAAEGAAEEVQEKVVEKEKSQGTEAGEAEEVESETEAESQQAEGPPEELVEAEAPETESTDVSGAEGDGGTIQRGEAGVHQNDITMPGMGVQSAGMMNADNPNQAGGDKHGWRNRDSSNLSPDQRASLQVYAGNFMSDFSQANVPKALQMMGNVPTMRGGNVTTIGAQGAGVLLQSILRSFAILELGTEAAALVTNLTTEMYEAERHIDNPMGTSAEDYAVSAPSTGTALATASNPHDPSSSGSTEPPRAVAIQTTDPTPEQMLNAPQSGASVPSSGRVAPAAEKGKNWFEQRHNRTMAKQNVPTENANDAALVARQTQDIHAGSAVNGLQFDNPALFQVSDAGLGNHIYNSIEASKQSYMRAGQAGPTPIGRMHVGYADHIVQDYFSHSNFIEVALNDYINDALRDGQQPNGHQAEEEHDEHEGEDHDHDHADHDHGHEHAPAPAGGDPRNKQEFLAAMSQQGDWRQGRQGVGEPDLVSPQFVAPMFDATSTDQTPGNGDDTGGRQAITTGTFGATDTMISLAHIFVPMLPKLHESLTRSVDVFLGVVDSAPPGAQWDTIQTMLQSGGRDGAVLHTMIQGMSDAGIGVSVPNGVEFTWGSLQVSPGWFGDPWTVDVPNGIGLTWADVPLTSAVGTYTEVWSRVNDLKRQLQRFSRYIGIDSVAAAIDRAWNAAKERFKRAILAAINKLVQTILKQVTEELQGTPVTPQQASKFASGGVQEALEMATHAMHNAEERTSVAYRLREGDMKDMSQAASVAGTPTNDLTGDGRVDEADRQAFIEQQRLELEQRVGPLRGSGTTDDPWVPIAPLPPSHSEIAKDHPPHAPGHHEHEHEHADQNPNANHHDDHDTDVFDLDPQREARRRKAEQEEDAHHHEHDHGHEDEGEEGAGGHDHEHGSSFFGLGIALAVEAQRHMYRQMELVWRQRTGNDQLSFTDFTDETGQTHSGAQASAERDRGMKVGHEDIVGQANAQAGRERERNKQRGFRRAQDSGAAASMAQQSPAMMDMLDMVDLFVSHPSDSSWWRTVVDQYVSQHPAEVYDHIRRRNAMAASQQRRTPGKS